MDTDSASRRDFLAHGPATTLERPRPWLFTRPTAKTGLISWLTTVDHKLIGLLYGFAALPVFTWMTLITSFLIVLSFPFITIALAELMMDRMFNTAFFDVSRGGLPILWQHLFWVFGHPEVYILIMPTFGIISEVIPTFARKPLFGYPVVVFSGAVIGFYGFTVWAHHMFTTGMGTVGSAAFALTTMAIAVPTGVKIFNWIGTLWGRPSPDPHAPAVCLWVHLDVYAGRVFRRDAFGRAGRHAAK